MRSRDYPGISRLYDDSGMSTCITSNLTFYGRMSNVGIQNGDYGAAYELDAQAYGQAV